jgi:hypothetical protein
MTKKSLYKSGAASLVCGAILVTLANLLAPQGDARMAVSSIALLGGLILMAGWAAVYLYQRKQSGRLGFVGFVLVLLAGMALNVGFPTVILLIYPWLAHLNIPSHTLNTGPVVFNLLFALSSGIVSIGGIIFGGFFASTRI